MRRAQAGDPAAFDELIEAHRDLLERVVRHFVRNGDDVDDITQEAWLRAATHIQDLREPSRFRPWLRSIARNSCMTFLKRQSRQRVATLDDDEAPEIADPDEATPEEHLLSRDEQRKVWETLGALSERDRTALFYREYQGLAYPEIAERLNISRNAAEVCVFRARERFRRLYYQVEREEQRCEFNGLQISMYMDGDLDDITHRRILKHLSGCGPCTKRLSDMSTGRDIYKTLAGLVLMPGTGAGMWAGVQHALAYLASFFGGGGGAAGGGALAAEAAATAGFGGAAATGAAAAAATGAGSSLSVPATLAAPVAASILAGALLFQGGTPPTIPDENGDAATAPAIAASSPAAGPSMTTHDLSSIQAETPSRSPSPPAFKSTGPLIVDRDAGGETSSATTSGPVLPDILLPPAYAAARGSSTPGSPPGEARDRHSGPPAHVANRGGSGTTNRAADGREGQGSNLPAHAERAETGNAAPASEGSRGNGSPPAHAATGRSSSDVSPTDHGSKPGQGSVEVNQPPEHARATGASSRNENGRAAGTHAEHIVRGARAMTVESDEDADRNGPPDRASVGGRGDGEDNRGNGNSRR